jgi:hypothetical protein
VWSHNRIKIWRTCWRCGFHAFSWFTHGQFLDGPFPMVLAKSSAESKSVPLGPRRFKTYRWQHFYLSECTLTFTHGWGLCSWSQPYDIHSWIVSSEVYLTVLTGSYPCGYYNRIKFCFSCVRQVRNLATRRFFPIGTHLDIHSCTMSSEVHLTSLSRVVTTTTESKSVSLRVGSKPAYNIFTVYRTELQ